VSGLQTQCEGCGRKIDLKSAIWIKFECRIAHYEDRCVDPTYLIELPFCTVCSEKAKNGEFNNFWKWLYEEPEWWF
jgi:hypothetical protein